MSITLDEIVLDGTTSSIAIKDSGGDELAIAADGSISVTLGAVTDLDIRDLVFATDKVDVSGSTILGITNDVSIDDGGNSITVDAVDLDVRDLTHVSDSVKVGDGTDFLAVNADGSINVNLTDDGIADDAADSGNPLKVGGRGVSGLLTALSASDDRFDLLGDLYRRVWVNNAYNVAIEVTTETVGATAAEIVATPMAGRKSVTIQNASNNSVWLGHSSGVTADNTATGGIEIKKNTNYSDDFGENIDLFLISDGAGRTVKVLEKG